MTRLMIYAALFAAAFGCSKTPEPAPPSSPSEATVRTIAQGKLVGFETADGAHSWRSIPFAAPPVGALRWRAPRDPESWGARRDATKFGPRCPQISNGLNSSEGLEPGLFLGDEDCLTLDIYAPPDAKDRDLPVMVWVHGGSNVWGRSSSYDGSLLAINEDVIIVAVQYRIGPLGFFANEMIRNDAQTPEDKAANFALLDLIASLKWVRENIGAFGGDAGNVTLFGESAGGHNVAMLLASPLAAGMFDKAIIQSGSFDSFSLTDAESTDGKLANPSSAIAERLGAADAAALRATSLKDLFTAYGVNETGRFELPRAIEDGVTLPSSSLREAFASTETFNAVPVITGTNRDEMKFFNLASPLLTKKILGFFLTPKDKAFYEAVSEYPSRIWRIRSVDEPAAMMASAGHEDVYAYRFDWDEGGKFLFSDFAVLIGAGHAVEIPFVFNRFQLFGPRLDPILFKDKTSASREELSRAMGAYWAAFARGDTPGDAGGTLIWPQWRADGGTLMRFDSANDGGIELMQGMDTMEKLAADLKADPRLTDAERCGIVDYIGVWLPELAAEIGADVGCDAQ